MGIDRKLADRLVETSAAGGRQILFEPIGNQKEANLGRSEQALDGGADPRTDYAGIDGHDESAGGPIENVAGFGQCERFGYSQSIP